MGKFVPYVHLFLSIFIWNFWNQLGLPFDQISLNYFKLIQINAKPYCSSGLGQPRFLRGPAHARPRPLIGRPHLSATPPPSTVPRPTYQLSLSPLCLAGRGQAPRHPRAAWHPHARDPPLFPSSFPSAALPPSRSLPARALTRPPIPTPLRPLPSSDQASPPLPAPGPPPATTGSPLSLTDSGRAPPPSATHL
jgi:hypothetical protein